MQPEDYLGTNERLDIRAYSDIAHLVSPLVACRPALFSTMGA